MPMTTRPYTTPAKVAAFLGLDEYEDEQFDGAIGAATAIIEGLTDRVFMAPEEAEAIYLDSTGAGILDIPEAIEVTEVAVGDGYGEWEVLAPSELGGWYTRPRVTAPFKQVEYRGGAFPRGRGTIRLTGRFAYSEVPPDDIAYAATVIAAGVYNGTQPGSTTTTAGGAVKSESIGNYSVTYESSGSTTTGGARSDGWSAFESVKGILERYRRYAL